MEINELKELDEKEIKRVGEIAKKHSNDDKIDINIFYKDFELSGPHTCYNPLSHVDLKPFQLAPFFKNIVIDIKPLSSAEEFEKYYGMSVERCYELKQNGLFKFRLSNNYIDYIIAEDDYLDLILLDKPPVSNVVNYSHGLMVNSNDNSALNEMINLIGDNEFDFGNYLLNDSGISDPYLISAFDIMAGHSYNIENIPDFIYKTINVQNFTKLWACGYNEINEFFKILLKKGNGRLDWTFVFSNIYTNFLSNPILDSLNGTQMIHSRIKNMAKDMSVQKLDTIFIDFENYASNFEFDDTILSSDILSVMDNTIGMHTLLDSNDLDDFDFNGAINALKTLEEIIDEKRNDEISDAALELQNELNNAGIIAKGLQEDKELKKDILSKVSWGLSGVGFAGLFFPENPYSWLLNLTGASGFALDSIIRSNKLDWVMDKINRFSKDNHVIYIYDNFDKINFQNLRKIDIHPKHNFSQFNDELTKKYEYYEYLYKNIPSIKVLIDINVQNIIARGPIVECDNAQIAYELNELNTKISLKPKLKIMLQYQFLYGASYNFIEINPYGTEPNITVINPHYVRTITNSGKTRYCVNYNNEKRICENIAGLHQCSIIEKNMPLLDTYYPHITKIESRPLMIYDQLEKNQNYAKKHMNNLDSLIPVFMNSLKLCRIVGDKGNEVKINYQIALTYMSKKEFDTALKYLYDAENIAQYCMSDKLKELYEDIKINIKECKKYI